MAKTMTKQVVNNKESKIKVAKVVTYKPQMDGVNKNLTLKVKYDLKKKYGLTAATSAKQIDKKDLPKLMAEVEEKIDILATTKYKLIKQEEDIAYIKAHFKKHLELKTLK